jgi:hypothetical protein
MLREFEIHYIKHWKIKISTTDYLEHRSVYTDQYLYPLIRSMKRFNERVRNDTATKVRKYLHATH